MCKVTCPVHQLGGMLKSAGQPLFAGITAATALVALREMLEGLGVSDAASFRTHDFRRGHALDLQLSGAISSGLVQVVVASACCSGAPLWQILAAGEWRSPAFMEYLDKYQLETDVVVQAHVGESDDEDAV